MRHLSDETSDTASNNCELMISTTTSISTLLLIDGIVGESYVFSTDVFDVQSNKNYGECCSIMPDVATVQLSQELVDQRPNNGETYIDCTLMESKLHLNVEIVCLLWQ